MDKTLFTYNGIKPVMAALAVLTAIQGAMIIAQAWFLANSISSLFGGDLFRSAVWKLAAFFGAMLARHFLELLKKRIAFRFSSRTASEMRKELLETLFGLGPRFVRAEGSGQTVTLVMEGIMKFQRYLELFLPKAINVGIVPAMVCTFVFFQNVRSAIILVAAFPILIVFMVLLGLAAKEKAGRQYKSYQMLSGHFVDSLRGLETLKYLGRSRSHIGKIRTVSEQYRKATMATLRVAFLSTFALDFFTMLSIATVAVFLGLDLIKGAIELKTALAILILAPEYFLPIREVGTDYHATLDGKEAAGKISSILSEEESGIEGVVVPEWDEGGTFSAENVRLPFSAEKSQIDFSITGMQKVGIIGASGAGKSTLIDVLSGFLEPEGGQFTMNGFSVPSLASEGWQHQLTYIPQHPYIFSGTLLENIRFYSPGAGEKEAEDAVKAAGLAEVLAQFRDGLHTKVGEGGRSLSGGQEQRVALARAFLGKRSVLMLDEPTAHLDIETEFELKETMLELFQGKLVFLATHRLHWMKEMNLILVLDGGNLVERGTHEELLAKKGYYYGLYKAQMEGME